MITNHVKAVGIIRATKGAGPAAPARLVSRCSSTSSPGTLTVMFLEAVAFKLLLCSDGVP
eukprot:2966256-Amphidinium_carterae.1